MANRTAEKERRTYEVIANVQVRRAVPLPPAPVRFKACRVCRQPIPVGVGQIAYYHGDCRKVRRTYRTSTIVPSKKIK